MAATAGAGVPSAVAAAPPTSPPGSGTGVSPIAFEPLHYGESLVKVPWAEIEQFLSAGKRLRGVAIRPTTKFLEGVYKGLDVVLKVVTWGSAEEMRLLHHSAQVQANLHDSRVATSRIVQVYGIAHNTSTNQSVLVMEKMDGNLAMLLPLMDASRPDDTSLPWATKLDYMYQVADCVAFVHTGKKDSAIAHVHSDIEPQNFLFKKDKATGAVTLKLTGFGGAQRSKVVPWSGDKFSDAHGTHVSKLKQATTRGTTTHLAAELLEKRLRELCNEIPALLASDTTPCPPEALEMRKAQRQLVSTLVQRAQAALPPTSQRRKTTYSQSSDVHSMGIVLYQIMTQMPSLSTPELLRTLEVPDLFSDEVRTRALEAQVIQILQQPALVTPLTDIPVAVPPIMHQVFTICTQRVPHLRPPARLVLDLLSLLSSAGAGASASVSGSADDARPVIPPSLLPYGLPVLFEQSARLALGWRDGAIALDTLASCERLLDGVQDAVAATTAPVITAIEHSWLVSAVTAVLSHWTAVNSTTTGVPVDEHTAALRTGIVLSATRVLLCVMEHHDTVQLRSALIAAAPTIVRATNAKERTAATGAVWRLFLSLCCSAGTWEGLREVLSAHHACATAVAILQEQAPESSGSSTVGDARTAGLAVCAFDVLASVDERKRHDTLNLLSRVLAVNITDIRVVRDVCTAISHALTARGPPPPDTAVTTTSPACASALAAAVLRHQDTLDHSLALALVTAVKHAQTYRVAGDSAASWYEKVFAFPVDLVYASTSTPPLICAALSALDAFIPCASTGGLLLNKDMELLSKLESTFVAHPEPGVREAFAHVYVQLVSKLNAAQSAPIFDMLLRRAAGDQTALGILKQILATSASRRQLYTSPTAFADLLLTAKLAPELVLRNVQADFIYPGSPVADLKVVSAAVAAFKSFVFDGSVLEVLQPGGRKVLATCVLDGLASLSSVPPTGAITPLVTDLCGILTAPGIKEETFSAIASYGTSGADSLLATICEKYPAMPQPKEVRTAFARTVAEHTAASKASSKGGCTVQ